MICMCTHMCVHTTNVHTHACAHTDISSLERETIISAFCGFHSLTSVYLFFLFSRSSIFSVADMYELFRLASKKASGNRRADLLQFRFPAKICMCTHMCVHITNVHTHACAHTDISSLESETVISPFCGFHSLTSVYFFILFSFLGIE